ncbi:hypothetical protein DFJ58DRAFT_615952, partial [Suillus subalutaceus]|uniref:uncharacterized protein n=1 Tax=Suillus subalutaceus TaxID=48586 RepID=UPI001B8738C2
CFLMLVILAMSVDVKHIFSHGHLLLSHVQSCLSAQTTCALLCVGLWGQLGLVKDCDIQSIASLPDIKAKEELQ